MEKSTQGIKYSASYATGFLILGFTKAIIWNKQAHNYTFEVVNNKQDNLQPARAVQTKLGFVPQLV